jgi:hypothetical protein
VLPLEFINDLYDLNHKIDSPDEYFNRPVLYNFLWGYSNVSRPILQGEMMKRFRDFHCDLALSYNQSKKYIFDDKKVNINIMFMQDWWERINIKELYKLQFKSKGVIDLYGAGLKCFRNMESFYNCVPFKQDPSKLLHTYEWIDGVNCVFLPTRQNSNIIDEEKSCEILIKYKTSLDLYNIYLESIKMSEKYHPSNYVKNHIIKNIL